MKGLTSLLLFYIVNSLWQVPLILLGAWVAARLLRPMGPAAEHRIWVSGLALEGVVPALSLLPWERMHLAWPWDAPAAATAVGNVAVVMGAGTAVATLRLPPMLAATLVGAYLAATTYCVLRFAWRCVQLDRLRRSADPVTQASDAAANWERWMQRCETGPVVLAWSTKIFAPVTMGIFVKRVLLPPGLMRGLTEGDLDTAIAHELAHVRRNDFVKNLLYEIVSLPVNYHPGVWFTRQRMIETREMICDEVAARHAGNHAYAQSLLRLATLLLQGRPVRVPHAIGVFDSNTLERRLMKLTETKQVVGRARRATLACACVALALVTTGSAVALRIGVGQKDSSDASSQSMPTSVSPKEMQDRLVTTVPPVYPPEAKKAHIQGSVVLQAVIGKSGHVENLKVVSGPEELQQSAMDAVRQWVYKPYLANGAAVEVATTVNIAYSLRK